MAIQNETMNRVAVILAALGAINCGIIGAFRFNPIYYLFGSYYNLERIAYVLIGLAGVMLLVNRGTPKDPTQFGDPKP